MSFSIYGFYPKSKRGEQFEGYFPPLWSYIGEHCTDILSEKDIREGYMNNGHRISKAKAKRLAQHFREHLPSLTTYRPDYGFHGDAFKAFLAFLEDSEGFEIC